MDEPMKQNNGFTLLELIVIVAIIGILSVVAFPKLFSISKDAQLASTKRIAAMLSSANADNYVIRVENKKKGVRITNCTSVANLLQGGLPKGYSIRSAKVGVNATVNCTLRGPSATTATFIATGIL